MAPLATMNCRRCGKEIFVIQAIQKAFCSVECRYFFKKDIPPDMPYIFTSSRSPQQKLEEIEEDAGLAWQRAGAKFEAMTKRALAREATTTFQQSIIIKDGRILVESNPNRRSNIRIRRAQYTLPIPQQAEIAKWFILGKILEQYRTYQVLSEYRTKLTTIAFTAGFNWLSNGASVFRQAKDLDEIRVWEARVAAAYFDTWRGIPLKWAMPDYAKIPDHWKIIGDRNSSLSGGNLGGKAVRPAQAILNHAYGVLEHVSRAALLAVGLDTSVGILHADKVGRESLIYDLMEFGRGTVDANVLNFLAKTEFHKNDFTQLETGEVRLHPELARAVVATCSITPDVMLNYATVLRNMIVGDQSDSGEEPNSAV